MNQSRFVQLSALAFGLILLSFITRGVTRLLFDYTVAAYVSAPLFALASLLVVGLLLRGLLDVTGLLPLEEADD
ncbi:MAG: hypothetical protein ABEH81_06760 [Halopenitus sp.]